MILRFAGVYDDGCHSPPLAHQMQRIYERQLAGHLYSGETSHGQSFVHMDDVVDAIERAVDRRAKLPAESVILIGEPETLSYDELQHTFVRLILDESWETHNVPGPIAKAGAWVEDHIPGQDPFIKPWMIDRANDHYALDITRARTLLDWEPSRSLRKTLPKMVAALKADPLGWYRENDLEPPASLKEKRATQRNTAREGLQIGTPSDHREAAIRDQAAPARTRKSASLRRAIHPAAKSAPNPGSARCTDGGVTYSLTCGAHLKSGDSPRRETVRSAA